MRFFLDFNLRIIGHDYLNFEDDVPIEYKTKYEFFICNDEYIKQSVNGKVSVFITLIDATTSNSLIRIKGDIFKYKIELRKSKLSKI